jgi:hypothetical protein
VRSYDPKITIGVLLDFERMTGVRTLTDSKEVLSSVSNLSALLYCSIKHQFPKLSYAKFSADLTPEDIGAAIPAISEELSNFFQRLGPTRESPDGDQTTE